MTQRIECAGLQVGKPLHDLIEQALPGTGVSTTTFWNELAALVEEFGPRNAALLERRAQLQTQVDDWHRNHRGEAFDAHAYRQFLQDIGYIAADLGARTISTTNVDAEIASIAGPQLVVPVDNARFALNAANARWGSLYDALYGTDVIAETDGAAKTAAYNEVRGAKVVAWAAQFLDDHFPLESGSHRDATGYRIEAGQLRVEIDGQPSGLAEAQQFVGHQGSAMQPATVLLVHHGLHVEIRMDRQHPIGKDHSAGVYDVVLESAITTIQDCEDSVVAVDAEDKARVYANWLGLMRGDLGAEVAKGGKTFTRKLAEDRVYTGANGQPLTLPGRSLMLVRNVGHHMTTPAVLDADGNDIFEGLLDALTTAAIAIHDLRRSGPHANSRTGSIYIVKPKMHGPDEVDFAVAVFAHVEQALGLPVNTLKIGIMDEERRTSINLKACIAQARERLIFINTGFLDRTGDEIHTSMEAGAMVPKDSMKSSTWLPAYEDHNVDAGLVSGLCDHAQIGKGMWALPDNMAAMMRAKIVQPEAGANCAWVPSPTAATLHAVHYHRCDVRARQRQLMARQGEYLDALLDIPLLDHGLSAQQIQRELDNNCQGILGYVVRWVEQGIGCSKVPDIDDIERMEDRATCRISSQHIANWLRHGLTSEADVRAAFERMAVVVDQQNRDDPEYRPMAADFEHSLAFKAACDLAFNGCELASGYTEPVLHTARREFKAAHAVSMAPT